MPGPGIPRGKLTPLSVASQLGFETTPMAPRGLGEAFDATTREPAGGTADGDSSP